MKILWFSNCSIAKIQSVGSGSWLYGMRDIISSEVQLYNITEAHINSFEYHEGNGVKEHLVPFSSKCRNGLPPVSIINKIQEIIDEISPDVIHIWGIEKYWSRLFAFGYIKHPNVLLEIQGLLSACTNMFFGGLTPREIFQTYRFKEFIKPSISLSAQYKKYYEGSIGEFELISKFQFISTQSDWTRYQISMFIRDNVTVFSTLRPIRSEFYVSQKWSPKNHSNPVIFTSVGYLVPFKGLHILLKAFRIIVNKYPGAKLVIAGFDINKPFYRVNGYDRFLLDFISKNDLSTNVVCIGKLNASQIIDNLLSSDIYVNPTFIESYSAATAEALYLGVPSVLSYAGALPNFSNHGKCALYYSPMDYIDCAAKIDQLFNNLKLQQELSDTSKKTMLNISCPENVVKIQLDIYKSVMMKNNSISSKDSN